MHPVVGMRLRCRGGTHPEYDTRAFRCWVKVNTRWPIGNFGIHCLVSTSLVPSLKTIFMRREGEGGARGCWSYKMLLWKLIIDYADLQIEKHLRIGTCPRRQRPRQVADEDLSYVPVAFSDFEWLWRKMRFTQEQATVNFRTHSRWQIRIDCIQLYWKRDINFNKYLFE